MKFPESVKVGPYKFTVTMCDRISTTVTLDKDASPIEILRFGEINYVDLDIKINTSCLPMQRWDTLIHEVLHAISSVIGDNNELTEDQVQAISPYLLAFLVDNGFLEVEELTIREQHARQVALEANPEVPLGGYIVSAPVKAD